MLQVMEAAKQELALLKQHISRTEQLKLIESTQVDCESILRCIYGIMTGSCFSERAQELIERCAVASYRIIKQVVEEEDTELELVSDKKKRHEWGFQYYTAIEVMLMAASTEDVNKMVCYLRTPDATIPDFNVDTWRTDAESNKVIEISCPA